MAAMTRCWAADFQSIGSGSCIAPGPVRPAGCSNRIELLALATSVARAAHPARSHRDRLPRLAQSQLSPAQSSPLTAAVPPSDRARRTASTDPCRHCRPAGALVRVHAMATRTPHSRRRREGAVPGSEYLWSIRWPLSPVTAARLHALGQVSGPSGSRAEVGETPF